VLGEGDWGRVVLLVVRCVFPTIPITFSLAHIGKFKENKVSTTCNHPLGMEASTAVNLLNGTLNWITLYKLDWIIVAHYHTFHALDWIILLHTYLDHCHTLSRTKLDYCRTLSHIPTLE
jgi:hypothetical protein